MSTYFLIVYLLLVGITQLVDTKLPTWVLGVTALAAALSLLIGASPWKKS